MEQLTQITGVAAPLLRVNIDTDQIIPGRFLVRTSDKGLAGGLFADWRFKPDGSPDPGFILNREPWNRAQILLADRNFGCGSSREAAPVALRQWGFRAVIAPSFGGIFYNNAFRNGLLPVELPIETVHAIAAAIEESQGQAKVSVDLEAERIALPDGRSYAFRVPRLLRNMLLKGLDEIDMTLSRDAEIERFRAADRLKRPWTYRPGLS
jgi:3-isopropylmalate/(R)-2-methylmalate dehydratase small subunit